MMNKVQQNYFRMYLNVQMHLDANTAVWNSIPRINDYKVSLDELISRITEKSTEAEVPVSVSDRKENLRTALSVKAASISGVLQAYALENGNPDLAENLKLTKTGIISANEGEIEPLVKKVLAAAQEHIEALADYGITESMVADADSTLGDFTALIGKPRNIMSQKYVTLDTVSKLFDECTGLLNNSIDKVMTLFELTNEEFYNGYQRARTIVDL